MTWAFYNEIDPYCAEWLRNLIRAGHIAPGYVDERSILDVNPDDLAEFGQCHFFAGLGAWSLALRHAGIPDDWPWWSGSAPCQPFSGAGKGGGFADERHLWPAFDWLIGQRRPDVVFGEQVSSPDGRSWYDLVSSDLEGHGYACGAVIAPAAGVGAFHQRHRMYWCAALADAAGARCFGQIGNTERDSRDETRLRLSGSFGEANSVADSASRLSSDGGVQRSGQHGLQPQGGRTGSVAEPDEGERRRWAEHGGGFLDGPDSGWAKDHGEPAGRGGTEFMADGDDAGLEGRLGTTERGAQCAFGPGGVAYGERHRASALDAPWRDADWLLCRDGKWRPVRPESQPLVDGSAFRVGSGSAFAGKSRTGMLRAYGNAIVWKQASEFVKAYLGVTRTVETDVRPVRVDDLFG